MNNEAWGPFALLVGPALVFLVLFRRSWSDGELLRAALAGCCAGVLATVPVKFFAYPALGRWLGLDLRQLVTGDESLWLKAGACFGIIAPVEEVGKWLGAIGGIMLLGLERRGPAIFLAFAAAGLGFSLAENLDYHLQYGSGVLLVRGVISSSGHIVFSSLAGMGAALALPVAKSLSSYEIMRGYGRMIFMLFFAITLHGCFNLAVFTFEPIHILPLLFLTLMAAIAALREGWVHLLLRDAGAMPMDWTCPGCGLEKHGGERFCPTCGTRVAARDSRGLS